MSKRAADTVEEHPTSLKAGERPVAEAPPNEMGEFEDEFEDEFESEDEILEAGVDGRPDAEREEEEKGTFPCFCFLKCKTQNLCLTVNLVYRYDGGRPRGIHSRKNETGRRRGSIARSVYVRYATHNEHTMAVSVLRHRPRFLGRQSQDLPRNGLRCDWYTGRGWSGKG